MAENELTIETQRLLGRMEADDLQEIDNQKTQLYEVYQNLPRRLQHTSELTGISTDQLIRIAAQTVFNHANIKWYQVISILESVYVTKKRLEEHE